MKNFEVSHVKIQDRPAVRDLNSKAVLSMDHQGLRDYRDKQTQMECIKKTEDRIGSLESDVCEIKNMLKLLLGDK